MTISKTQIDRLGDRLRAGSHTEDDLRLLDDYRRSFGEAYDAVIQKIRECGGTPTGRLAKSTLSIAQKLKRESMRLTQMQDIAGCRVIVGTVVEQNQFVETLRAAFAKISVIDRREKPSFGYRAVHVIVEMLGKPVEVQVRTSLQHQWAELSEKCSDVIDPAVKYGGGPDTWRIILTAASDTVAHYEKLEYEETQSVTATAKVMALYDERMKVIVKQMEGPLSESKAQELRNELEERKRAIALLQDLDRELRVDLDCLRNSLVELFRKTSDRVDGLERKKR